MFGNRKHTKKDCKITVIEKTDLIIYDGNYYKKYDHNDIEELRLLNLIIKKLNQMAVTLAEFKAAFAEINESTTNIAADIEKLTNSIASGLSDAEEQEALSDLRDISEKLKAIAATTPDGAPTPPPA